MTKSAEQTEPSILEGEWLTLAETMRLLEKSQSSVDRFVAGQEIRTKTVPRPRRKPERLYSAEDVKRLAASHAKAARGLSLVKAPVSTQLAIPAEAISSLRDVTAEWGKGIAASLHELMTEWQKGAKAPRLSEKLWLSLDEAVEYSGLARADLLLLCQQGKLIARKSGGWKIQRRSLEAFDGKTAKAAHA